MINTRFPFVTFKNDQDHFCQIGGISRRPALIRNYVQFIALVQQTKHRFHEIVPKFGIEPRSTDNDPFIGKLTNSFLASQFRFSVNRQRICGRIFLIRHICRTVEHIIGRDMNNPHTRFGQIFGSGVIYLIGQFFIGFSLIHRCISSTIDDIFNGIFRNKMFNLCGVGNIQDVGVGINKSKRRVCFFRHLLQFLPQLSVCSGNQNVFLNQSVENGAFFGDGFRSAKMLI
ncbi:hypothetical protein SDC9_124219 [bioreactor metagenome]|uniref:Uncharacterized protein n=1 Tax=bioreactor metagenome TaxID=1076179 RepID=A0A645CJV4_9ZZZZ